MSGYAFGSLDELGDGYGFRKVRRALGITAFGVNGIVMPPSFEGFLHFHDRQDELYFVHRGHALVEVGDETREVGEGGLIHVEAETARRVSNSSDSEDLVLLEEMAMSAAAPMKPMAPAVTPVITPLIKPMS